MRLRKLIFGIAPEETTFARRGFQGAGGMRDRLEEIGRTFVRGYHAALEENTFAPKLDREPNEFRGFAYEGAAMGLALLDRVTPWRRSRWQTFLAGPGEPHTYMLHVGLGWVFARLRLFSPQRIFDRLDPVLRWLTLDGYGFHQGFFTPFPFRVPSSALRVHPYAARACDQGLGRSLWFSQCADPEKISKMIMAFDLHRQADLWSGVGLACGYAGNLQEDGLQALVRLVGEFHLQLAQGVAFAAKARQRAGNIMPFTELASQIICGMSADQAAQLTDEALENLPTVGPDSLEPPYEVWRCRIQKRFAKRKPIRT